MFRRFICILIGLGLALHGVALYAQAQSPCPMQATMSALLAANDGDTAALPDCCNDLPTFAATGKACKADGDCGTSSVIAPGSAPAAAPAGVASAAPRAGVDAPLLAPISLPWRPPAAR